MSDTEFDIDTSKLTPANQNPWYILMTLYGEQEGDEIDWELHEKNRQAWNIWVCHHMNKAQREEFVTLFGLDRINENYYREMISFVKKQYYENWNNRNGEHIAPDDIPIYSSNISMNKILFKNKLSLSSMVFNKNFSLKYSTLENDTFFNRSIFCGSFTADCTDFKGNTTFDVSEFRKGTSLKNCHFCGKTYFRNASFDDVFIATDAIFFKLTYFYLSSFSKIFLFDKAKFQNGVRFRGAKFHDIASFRGVQFECQKTESNISFNECIFYKNLDFGRAAFKTSFPDFTGTMFLSSAVFTPDDDLWPKKIRQSNDIAKRSVATIRHLLSQQGHPEDSHFFFRREMYFAGQTGSIWERLPYLIYGWLSDYGYSILKPVTSLSVLWALGIALIGSGLETHQLSTSPLSNAAALSFSNLFPFFGFTGTYFEPGFLRELPAPLKVLSAAQTVLSLPLLFFLGLGLRTRFRMR